MRKLAIPLGTALLLTLILRANGQQGSNTSKASSFLTGADPSKLTPLDPSKFSKTVNLGNAVRKPNAMGAFSMSNMFRKVPIASWPPRRAQGMQFPKTLDPSKTKQLFDFSKKPTK